MRKFKLFEEFVNELNLTINEGQFSWMTFDTDKQIGSERENRITVYMYDNEGNRWEEKRYGGYGEFGGMDYYELLATMNGYSTEDLSKGEELRDIGIDLAYDQRKFKPRNSKKVLYPALVEDPKYNWKRHDFEQEAENDPNQSGYQEPDYDDYYYESKVTEAKRSTIHKAAKNGSYPAVVVVIENGKVIHQEKVVSPEHAPAVFNVMQEKYPKAILHLEDNTGKRLFSESIDEAVELVHVYDEDGKMFGTGELVKTKGKKSLIRWDGSREDWIDSDLVKLVEKREDVGKYNTVKKVVAKLGRRPSEQELAQFITDNYYDVTEVEIGDDGPRADDKIADLVSFYKFDIDDWEIAWEDAQNESVVNEASKDRMIKQIKRALKDGTSIFKLPMATQKYYYKNKGDFEVVNDAKKDKIYMALGDMEDWMPDDPEIQDEYYTITSVKDMIDFFEEYADTDVLQSYGLTYKDLKDLAKAALNESIVNEASAQAYALHMMADKVGQEVAGEFLANNNINLELLTKAIGQGAISKYELRDIVKGTAHKATIKRFLKEFINESVSEEVYQQYDFLGMWAKIAGMTREEWITRYGTSTIGSGIDD